MVYYRVAARVKIYIQFTSLTIKSVGLWDSAGTILKTTNGGENWFLQGSGIANYLQSVYFTDNQTGWAVGYYGTILKTTRRRRKLGFTRALVRLMV